MAKMKPIAPKSVAKKDNTNVARTRVSSELVGDKPNYNRFDKTQELFHTKGTKPTKSDSLAYEYGFRDQINKDKKAGKSTDPSTAINTFINQGRYEAWGRRYSGELNKKALTRDSSIPLAPTQFPD